MEKGNVINIFGEQRENIGNHQSEIVLPSDCDSSFIMDNNALCVWRPAKPASKIIPIVEEYDGIGFISRYEGGLQLRTLAQQQQFISRCLDVGLPVSPTHGVRKTGGTDGLVFPYIIGIPLSQCLAEEQDPMKLRHIVEMHIQDLQRAHAQEIVYGDRWGPNEIVTFDDRLIRIDLDFELSGSHAANFELAQAIYHTVFFAKEEEKRLWISAMLGEILEQMKAWKVHSRDVFLDLLNGHHRHFQGTKYSCPEIQALHHLLCYS